jgi:hypothetical protein
MFGALEGEVKPLIKGPILIDLLLQINILVKARDTLKR